MTRLLPLRKPHEIKVKRLKQRGFWWERGKKGGGEEVAAALGSLNKSAVFILQKVSSWQLDPGY